MADRNFHFSNNLAYTEDSILIYNLFIYKISAKTTEDDCRQYLSRFGEIIKFRFNVKRGGQRKISRHAFVNYKNAENATCVLRKQNHTISPGKNFYVKACDSWHQPKMPATSEQTKTQHSSQSGNSIAGKAAANKKTDAQKVSNIQKENGKVNLLDLNEDCLMVILSYLPLHDQVSLARSHIDLETIFRSYAKIYYKTIGSDKFLTMSLWNIREMFLIAGEFFENFTFTEWFQNNNKERIISFVQSNCPNLRKIKMDTSKVRVPSLYKILTNKSHLTHLTLSCLTVTDNCVHAMKKTPTLEYLSIVHCFSFTGRFLYLLPQLKYLCLANCSSLNSANLIKALSVMPNLIALDITGAERLHKSVFDALPEKNKNLETLRISCIDNFDSIAKLQNLRCLGLYCDRFNGALRSSTFKLLIENCDEKLQSLQIVSRQSLTSELCELISKFRGLKKLHIPCNPGIDQNCLKMFGDLKNLVEIKLSGVQSMTNKILLELVRNCPLLKWINIQNTPIDNEFAKNLLPILKKNNRTNGRLIFLVSGTQIDAEDLPNEYETAEIKALAEFVFDFEKYLRTYDNFYDEFEKDFNGMGEVPFFDCDQFGSDSDDEHDDDDIDDDDSDYGFDFDLDDMIDPEDLFLNAPFFRALRNNVVGYPVDYIIDSDDDIGDEDIYLW